MFDVAKALLIPFASLQLLDLKPSFVYASIIMRMNLLLWKQFINLRQLLMNHLYSEIGHIHVVDFQCTGRNLG